MKPTIILITALALSIFTLFMALESNSSSFEESKKIIIIREIGHKILLQSHDSTSRVLPVRKLKGNQYQIQFESPISFNPDSLVTIISGALSHSGLPSDYIVKVVECASSQPIFGYAIFETNRTAIVPCLGRLQPEGCYFINLTFKESRLMALKSNRLTLGAAFLALILSASGVTLYYNKKRVPTGLHARDVAIRIGNYLFYGRNSI